MSINMTTGRSRGLSLKATLAMVIATLAILILIACGIAGADAWRGYVGAGRVAEVNANTDLLLKGLESIQLERGQTNTALQAPAPVTARSATSSPSAGPKAIPCCRMRWSGSRRAGFRTATG